MNNPQAPGATLIEGLFERLTAPVDAEKEGLIPFVVNPEYPVSALTCYVGLPPPGTYYFIPFSHKLPPLAPRLVPSEVVAAAGVIANALRDKQLQSLVKAVSLGQVLTVIGKVDLEVIEFAGGSTVTTYVPEAFTYLDRHGFNYGVYKRPDIEGFALPWGAPLMDVIPYAETLKEQFSDLMRAPKIAQAICRSAAALMQQLNGIRQADL